MTVRSFSELGIHPMEITCKCQDEINGLVRGRVIGTQKRGPEKSGPRTDPVMVLLHDDRHGVRLSASASAAFALTLYLFRFIGFTA
jgi:hypothetical protein